MPSLHHVQARRTKQAAKKQERPLGACALW